MFISSSLHRFVFISLSLCLFSYIFISLSLCLFILIWQYLVGGALCPICCMVVCRGRTAKTSTTSPYQQHTHALKCAIMRTWLGCSHLHLCCAVWMETPSCVQALCFQTSALQCCSYHPERTGHSCVWWLILICSVQWVLFPCRCVWMWRLQTWWRSLLLSWCEQRVPTMDGAGRCLGDVRPICVP